MGEEIRELTLKENYRYRDIAVISRNPDSYIGILDVALNERNIHSIKRKTVSHD